MTAQSLAKLESRVSEMVNRTFLVNSVTHKVLSYNLQDQQLTLVTDRKWFKWELSNAPLALEGFLESSEEALPVTSVVMPIALEASMELKNILLENIQKVRESQGYIPQADAIAKQVQTLINLAKAEMHYKKMAKD